MLSGEVWTEGKRIGSSEVVPNQLPVSFEVDSEHAKSHETVHCLLIHPRVSIYACCKANCS